MISTLPRSGGRILADQLKIHGVDLIFGVPGESYLDVLDALHDHQDAMKFIICRMEAGAANMAEAHAKLTGKPGICMVTRGPGATHAAVGVHTAYQDSTPLILFIGQVGNDAVEREAFQEIDYRRMFGPMAKWVAQIDRADRVPEYIARAFATATSGRPGPVVLALPEDMLTDTAIVADAKPYHAVQAAPAAADMARLADMLKTAKTPFVLVGGGNYSGTAQADLIRFAENQGLPVGCAFRAQDGFDNGHPNYAGDVGIGINPKLAERVKNADLLLVVGPRLGEMTTSGYTLLDVPNPKQQLIHIHPGAEELNRVYQADLAICSGMENAAAALAALPRLGDWSALAKAARAEYEAWQTPPAGIGALDMGAVMMHLRDVLPADAIMTNGAGNYSVWLHRFHRYRRYRSQLAPTSGAMGYGVPAAVAASIAAPDRLVVSFNGDGCFMMCGQELATALQYDAKPILLVINNGMYGTIRMHQERHYPGRVSGTDLRNPDFAALARAYGAHGETVTETAQFPAAFARARAAGTAALIELKIDPEALTVRQSLSDIRAQALAAKVGG